MEDITDTSPTVRRRCVNCNPTHNDVSESHHSNGVGTLSNPETERSTSFNSAPKDSDRSEAVDSRANLDFINASRLTDIMNEANLTYDKLQERFSAEYRSLLHSAVSSANRVHSRSYDSTIPDRVNFSFSARPQEKLTKKRFTGRESLLTELLKINHIRTVYNIFAAILIIFSVQTIVYDLIEQGRVVIDFGLISWGFGKFPLVISIWMCMKMFIITLYPSFNLWIQLRTTNTKLMDRVFLGLYVLYVCVLMSLPVWALAEYDLPPISTLVVAIEQVRMLMKAHSFIRENVPRVLSKEKGALEGLDFSRYLYFLFAPTLIYRDEYPRTREINWTSVVFDVAQLIICIFYTYYIFMRFCIPNFHNFNSDHVTVKAFVFSVFGCMMPGTLVLLIGFFAVLHCWLNAWAEMLTFADRLFYKDWWNSTNFSGYYRNWNIVVHDWLYSYVYQDLYMLLGFRRNWRWAAMYTTFLLSALFHEYIIILSFRFVYPVLFVMFGVIGVGLIYVNTGQHERSSNIFMWVMLFVGNGILMCLYSVEYFSRKNCPPVFMDSFVDYLVPRSLFCEAKIEGPMMMNVTES